MLLRIDEFEPIQVGDRLLPGRFAMLPCLDNRFYCHASWDPDRLRLVLSGWLAPTALLWFSWGRAATVPMRGSTVLWEGLGCRLELDDPDWDDDDY
jgi:hypothetical protein